MTGQQEGFGDGTGHPALGGRTFGTAFGEADEKFDALEASPVHESEELYILAANATS